jgi:translation initiation factor IF-3
LKNKIRLIDKDGEQIGIVTLEEASKMAKDSGLDLVEVSPNANPQVVKLMDYGKYKYQISKQKKQKVFKTKNVKFRPNTSDHDCEIKIKKVMDFLDKGNKVKLIVNFRGREVEKPEFGFELINSILNYMDGYRVESEPKLEGNNITTVLSPI